MGLKKIIRYISVLAIITLYQNCGGFESSQDDSFASLGSGVSFKCADDRAASETKSLMLSNKQLGHAIEDLFGSNTLSNVSGALSAIPAPINDSTTHVRQSLVSASEVDGFHALAQAVAADVVNSRAKRESVFGTCSSQATPAANCIDQYISGFAVKIFRRPLNNSEQSFIRNLANSGGNYLTNLEAVLAYSLQSPFFLWRLELGSGTGAPGATVSLTQYEIASRISFATTDSIPDDALLSAAQQGQLSSLAQIKTHTERLLKSPRGQEKVADMLAWWALSDRSKDVSNLPSQLTGGLNVNGLTQAIGDETRTFIKEIVFSDQGSFRDLLTSKKSFAAHDGLATIYGHAPVSGSGVAAMSGRRQGLLMRAGFLTHDTFRTSLIHRGVDFQKRYLCQSIASPNVDIAADRDADALTTTELLNTTNREAVAHQTQSPVCMSCHSVINPTGFAFENFDSLGRIRNQEMIFDQNNGFVRSLPVDTTTDVPLPNGQTVPVSDAYDLITGMVDSGIGAACMTRNLYRFVNEKHEMRSDDCELERVFNGLNNPDQPMLDALVDLIANEHVVEKVY